VYDFWHDTAPGVDVHNEIYYSTNWYTERAQSIVVAHTTNASAKDTPLWLHLMYQGVHSPYVDPPAWEGFSNSSTPFWDKTFGDMLHVVDTGIGNLTSTIRAQGAWDDCLLIITSDNGGVGPGNNYPFRGMKATGWEGGTRVMGFLSGGFLPVALRGKTFSSVIGVFDWYPTLCAFAGVDPTDDVMFEGVVRPIDGVNVWPAMLASVNASKTDPDEPTTYLHEYLPTTGSTIIWQERWKLITGESSTIWYTPNNTHIPDNWPCRGGKPPSPPAPKANCTVSVAGYGCHAEHYCGPGESFHTHTKATAALECAELCTANGTGCGCFDFRSGDDPSSCRLHANKGENLTPSGAGYAAFVKQSGTGTSRVAHDQADEASKARRQTARYGPSHESHQRTASLQGCAVCTAAEPCLFDVIADPSETTDVAKQNPDIVTQLQAKLATFQPYIGTPMTPAELLPYTCVKDIRPWWGNFSGPCCKPNTTA
jgi:hypothetical protein